MIPSSTALQSRIPFLLLICVALLFLSNQLLAQDSAARTASRVLYDFEKAGDATDLNRSAEKAEVNTVQDLGVTEGKNCGRVVFRKGADYATFELGAAAIKNWSDFDYFAIDVTQDDPHPYRLVLELWDGLSRNYATRCTYESTTTHDGRQTLLYRINRAKRNGKEGREWEELEPEDKIQLDALKRVKLFLTPREDRDCVLWVDNIRLLQEDAAKPKLRVPLPPGAIAFDFGSPGAVVPGFQGVSPDLAYDEEKQPFGFVGAKGLSHGGEGWPDLLSGTFVHGDDGDRLHFRAEVPNGKYRLWLLAGKIIRPDMRLRRFRLQVNDTIIYDELPTFEEFCGDKYLSRFLWTQYSEKPNALWNNYIEKMYPGISTDVVVQDGHISVTAMNHFLSAAILIPNNSERELQAAIAAINDTRRAAFEQGLYTPKRIKPQRQQGEGPFVVFLPEDTHTITPDTAPALEERSWTRMRAAGAPGQRVALRIAVAPYVDLGKCTLQLPDLLGPGEISRDQFRGYYQNYRWDGKILSEMALLPSLSLEMEKGITQCFWIWLEIPDNAPAGQYGGRFTFETQTGSPVTIPFELEVYPFRLATDIPVSYGMYYRVPQYPAFPRSDSRRLLREQLGWMREIGFTGVTTGSPELTRLGNDGRITLRFDRDLYAAAKEVGMGRRSEQMSLASSLGVARAIGRRLPGSEGALVDQRPGIELRQPEFRNYYRDAMTQYEEFIKKSGLPVAMEIVDEPRETPNPWNRNLDDTIIYADLLHEIPGLRTVVNPMGDKQSGLDYTVLAKHADIISVHAWNASSGLINATRREKKTLWIYNTGMDRFSWGFYNWKMNSGGRWEWHFSWPEDTATGGYPGREWYNPFTGMHGFALHAPLEMPGAMLFQSRYLDVAEGITDYTYLHTLEVAMEANRKAGTNGREVLLGETLMANLRKQIPDFPTVHGLDDESQGALVGTGTSDPAATRTDDWRANIAELLKILSKS